MTLNYFRHSKQVCEHAPSSWPHGGIRVMDVSHEASSETGYLPFPGAVPVQLRLKAKVEKQKPSLEIFLFSEKKNPLSTL